MGIEAGFGRDKISPVDYMRSLGWPTDHITYDPAMRKGDYYIVRQSVHDGTLFFEQELLQRTLVGLAIRMSCHKSQEGSAHSPNQMTYIVGPLKLSTVYGMVDLPAGRFAGVRQRTRIPVRSVIQPLTAGEPHAGD